VFGLQEADSEEGGGYLTASSELAMVVPTVMECALKGLTWTTVGGGGERRRSLDFEIQ